MKVFTSHKLDNAHILLWHLRFVPSEMNNGLLNNLVTLQAS